MKGNHNIRLALTGVALLILTVALAACGGGSGSQEHTFTIRIQDGAPAGGAATFRVRQDDMVTFSISSDTEGEVHLHGYDLENKMTPGETVIFSFTANATGRFLIEIEGKEVELGYLEVQPR